MAEQNGKDNMYEGGQPTVIATNLLMLVTRSEADPGTVIEVLSEFMSRYRIRIDREYAQDTFESEYPFIEGASVRCLVVRLTNAEEVEQDVILSSIVELDRALPELFDGTVVAVAPNWLTSTSPPHIGTVGGPGAQPVVNTGSDGYRVMFYPQSGSSDLHDMLDSRESTENVTIVLLDTAPDPSVMEQAAERNELMRTLHQRLHLHIDSDIQAELDSITQSSNEYKNAGHNYEMLSHGIFAAGLIHSIAPDAEIHLIRVLNQYGVGTANTLLRGLDLATKLKADGQPLVINMSLTLAFPSADMLNRQLLPDALQGWDAMWQSTEEDRESTLKMLEQLGGDPRQRPPVTEPSNVIERLRFALELATRNAAGTDVLLVAAAGNERKAGDPGLPLTMYPAAYDDVIGVGALRPIPMGVDPSTLTSVQYAPYSNSVDKPAEEGFAVRRR